MEREFDGELKGEYLGVWLLHLSDRVSCGMSCMARLRHHRDRRVHLFLPYFFSGKMEKARLRRCVFLVPPRTHVFPPPARSHKKEADATQSRLASSHSFLLSKAESTNSKRLPNLSSRPARGRSRQQWGSKKWFACVGSICREFHDRQSEEVKSSFTNCDSFSQRIPSFLHRYSSFPAEQMACIAYCLFLTRPFYLPSHPTMPI